MSYPPQISIPACYMRGGTSKGVFFRLDDLPARARQPGAARDGFLLRVIGSPDPYAKHTDGMGGATSSTSKAVILSASKRAGHDVDYLFGQVSIDQAFVDWSGNCGNLSAAVGAFAIHSGLVDASRLPENGIAEVRIWQANIHKTIIAEVPISDGTVQETGDFELDGVSFAAAEIKLQFHDPVDAGGSLFPTGHLLDELKVPGIGGLPATMINAGIPTIFIRADRIGYDGTELQQAINSDAEALARLESIRAHGAMQMGLIQHLDEAAGRQHTPKLALVGEATDYVAASGRRISATEVDLNVRALSMGKLHHAMMGTAAVAIGTAAAIPGTLVNQMAGGEARQTITFGHPSGSLTVAAETEQVAGEWQVKKVVMSRSARRLMQGSVLVPGDAL